MGQSTLTPKQVKRLAADAGEPRVLIADNMTLNGLIETFKLADEEFQPRFGVSLRIVEDTELRDKKAKQRTFFPKVYPQNWEAMQALFRTLSLANTEEKFYMVPRLNIEDLEAMLDAGDFTVTSGDFYGVMEMPNRDEICQMLAKKSKNFFLEVCPVPTGYHDRVNAYAAEMSVMCNMQCVLTWPSMYLEGYEEAFEVFMGFHNRSTVDKEVFMRRPPFKGYSYKTPREMMELIKTSNARLSKLVDGIDGSAFWKGAIANQTKLYDSVEYVWEKQPIALPNLAEDPDLRVKELCIEGLRKRMSADVFGERIEKVDYKTKYLPRLKYELDILKEMGFSEYFLLVDDLVRWCKTNGILVGPGRGSVGGSLVAYLMGITDVDPIRFGLIFERFINPSRKDLPDIDLDFMSTRRHEVIEYLVERFGASKVAGISNYTMLGSSSGIKDAGRVFGIDPVKLNASKFVPKVHGSPVSLEVAEKEVAEISMLADNYPEMWRNAVKLQGTLRSLGRHAAGTIVAGCDITDLAVVERRSGEPTINWDMRVAESMGLVKLDILGLSTLDTIGRTLDFIKKRHPKVPDILSIPLDDERTLKAFSEGKTVGVFQFEGGAARRILKDMSKVSPVSFDDIVAANALNRPGPIDAGLVAKYVDAKNGEAENELADPAMEDALKETYNVIVYQEQVMKVAVDLCGFSLADADILRKAMGKKDAEMMAKVRTQFVDGAESHSGMDRELAEDLFAEIEVFAGYAFNKSHAAEYSLISYQCMWLKVNYPVEFYAAALSTVKEDKLKPILKDALEAGIEVMPPDINVSEEDFVIANDTTLITPFTRVKRAAGKAADMIRIIRMDGKIKSIADLKERLTEKKLGRWCNKRVIENLDAVGAFAYVEEGQDPPLADSRIKDQLTLMPGLVTRVLRVDEKIPQDKHTRARIVGICKRVDDVDPHAVHCAPGIGKRAKFMAVADCPSWSEENDKMFTKGKSFDFMREAMAEAGLSVHDGYWTGLLKRVKDDKVISPDEIKTYGPFLNEEVELLKPQLIIPLGSASARHFIPDLKGSIMDHIGSTRFLPKLDATVLIGFNPAMIFHDRNRMDDLITVMQKAAEIVG